MVPRTYMPDLRRDNHALTSTSSPSMDHNQMTTPEPPRYPHVFDVCPESPYGSTIVRLHSGERLRVNVCIEDVDDQTLQIYHHGQLCLEIDLALIPDAIIGNDPDERGDYISGFDI